MSRDNSLVVVEGVEPDAGACAAAEGMVVGVDVEVEARMPGGVWGPCCCGCMAAAMAAAGSCGLGMALSCCGWGGVLAWALAGGDDGTTACVDGWRLLYLAWW